ncbi:hypothetical protein Tco_0548976 [Tanacetum coccineum]
MNQDFYNSNLSGFDQFQPPQFPNIHQNPQETSKEILQAREDLMEAIEAFLKEYDHIPPNEKCMALLLAEERFFKIKQAMREEQNQPGVMQELLLKLINDLQILKGIQQEKKKPAAQGFIPYWNFSMIDDEEARDNFLKDVCTFLRKFSRIPFGVTPKVILIAWESFGKIKDALMDKQYQQEDIQELMSKLLEDVRDISEEPKAITPDEPIEEPNNSLSMGDEHLSTISITESDEIIKSSVENLVLIPTDFDPNDDTSSDDDSLENIEYVDESLSYIEYDILEEVNDDDHDEKEFDLCTYSSNPRLSFSISYPVANSDSFVEESDTSLSHLDNSLPEFETSRILRKMSRSGLNGGEIDVSQNVEDDDSFTFVIRTFLLFLTYPANSPLLLSTGSEDTIFDPGIST